MKTMKLIAVGALAASVTLAVTAGTANAFPCFGWGHARRAEVLHRDGALRNEIASDRGYLHGHFGQLMSEDRAIRAQEQRDAWRNGGYITPWQQARLNREENNLQRQINRDY